MDGHHMGWPCLSVVPAWTTILATLQIVMLNVFLRQKTRTVAVRRTWVVYGEDETVV